jgi:UDP-glucose 4-epimerase
MDLPIEKQRVLVTGANGLLGNFVMKELYSKGCEAVGTDLRQGSGSELLPPLVTMDLKHPQAVMELESLLPFDAIVHCAAVIPECFTGESASESSHANQLIDANVIRFAHANSLRLLYCSTASGYDLTAGYIDENQPLIDQGLYQQGKNKTEQHVRRSLESYVIFRICAPYGPGQRLKTVLKLFIENALAGRDICFHGSGAREQDFVFAGDFADAVCCALVRSRVSGIFNIAGGRPISMRELAWLVQETITPKRSRVRPSGQPDPQEKNLARFDISKAAEELGWTPRTSLEEGIGLLARCQQGGQ